MENLTQRRGLTIHPNDNIELRDMSSPDNSNEPNSQNDPRNPNEPNRDKDSERTIAVTQDQQSQQQMSAQDQNPQQQTSSQRHAQLERACGPRIRVVLPWVFVILACLAAIVIVFLAYRKAGTHNSAKGAEKSGRR